MHLSDFINFSHFVQIQIIWEKGVYLGTKAHSKYNIVVYKVHGFYVETIFDPAYDEIIHLEAFESIDKMDPYLREIDLQMSRIHLE